MRILTSMFPKSSADDRLTISSEPHVDLVFRPIPPAYGRGGITDVIPERLDALVKSWFADKDKLAKARGIDNTYSVVADDYVRMETIAGPVDHLEGDSLIEMAALCYGKMNATERARFHLSITPAAPVLGVDAQPYGTPEQFEKAVALLKQKNATTPATINKHLVAAGLPEATPEQIAALKG